MKKLMPIVVLSLASCALASCTVSQDQAIEVDPNVAEARQTSMQLGRNLKMILQDAMKNGGPVVAMQVCNQSAPAVTAQVETDSGWKVGRTSLKYRNASNQPDAWEQRVMEQFEQRKQAGESPQTLEFTETVVTEGRPTFRYMKAIPTDKVCMACHGGEAVSAEVVAKLQELYPGDQARGFKPGDLRGAFTLSKIL